MDTPELNDYGELNYGEFLFREFCNHVYLGQWELVKAFAVTITRCQTIDKSYKEKLKDTLKSLAENPYLARSSWSKFPSPSYVSFLSSQLLQQVHGSKDEYSSLRKIAEFNVMLEECFPKFTEQQIQELARIYSAQITKVANPESSNHTENLFFELSEETMDYARSALLKEPSVISPLLKELCSCDELNNFNESRAEIFNLILSGLQHCLKQVESSFAKKNESRFAEYFAKCRSILSSLPDWQFRPGHHDDGITDHLDEVLASVLSLCKKGVLQLNDVYSSLVTRQSCDYLRYFCSKEDEISLRMSHRDFPPFLSDGNFSIQDAVLWSIKNKSHFLEILLNVCTQKVLSGNISEVAAALPPGTLLGRLVPFILILSWSACNDDDAFNNCISATKSWIPMEGTNDDVALIDTCNKFLTNISFKENCVEYYINQFPEAKPKDVARISNSVFTQLQMHSPLAILQRVFGLKHMNPATVLDLLNCFSKGSNGEKLNSSGNWTAVAAARDSAIYHSYLAITFVMEAIIYSTEIVQFEKDANRSQSQSHSEVTDDTANDSSEPSQVSIPKDETIENDVKKCVQTYGIQLTYDKFVAERLENTRKEIKSLCPFTYRIEILENLFSLLFLSSRDLHDGPSDYSDSDQGHEGEEKYSSSSVRGTSIKSEKEDLIIGKPELERVDLVLKQNGNYKFLYNEREGESSNRPDVCPGKVQLKEPPKIKTEHSEPYSGHGSSRSAGSSGSSGISKSGFLCNEFIVGDLLQLLKDAILEVNAEIYKSRSDCFQTGEDKENSQNAVFRLDPKTSVENDDVQRRLGQLMKYVDEANWRFKLVRSDSFKTISSVRVPNDAVSSTSGRSLLSQRQSSGNNTEGSDSGVQKRKKKKKRKQVSKPSFFTDVSSLGSGVIHHMLSRPDALLRYCLWRQNEEDAMEVIKMCGLMDSVEAKELAFSRQIHQLCEKIRSWKGRERYERLHPVGKETASLMTGIIAIANAATSGLQSTVLTSVIDPEIHQWNIPPVAEMSNVLNCISPAEKVLLAGAENLCSISLSDIACARSMPLSHSVQILEMSLQQWTHPTTSNITSAQKRSFSFIPGNHRLTQSFLDLGRSFQSFFANIGDAKIKKIFFPCIEDSATFSDALVNCIGPLNSSAFANQLEAWKVLSVHLANVENLLQEDALSSTDNCVNPKNKLHVAYKFLFKYVKDLSNWSSEAIRPHPLKYKNYLKKLYVYLQQVTGALMGCKDQNVAVGLTSYTSYFSALKESPANILRNMIDQNKISQQKIEKFAKGMKVDFGEILIQTFLPPVSLFREISFNKLYLRDIDANNLSACPSIILNKSDEKWPMPRHPDLAARELLRDLISMAQDVAMAKYTGSLQTPSALLSLSRHSELASWMTECSELAHVDLDLLQTPEELKAFFINVTNLLSVHALLLQILMLNSEQVAEANRNLPAYVYNGVSSSKASKFQSPPVASPYLVQRVMQQKTVGYCIGQLGAISLFDLRYNILHLNFPTPKHLNTLPYNKLCLSEQDLPLTWLKYTPKADPRQIFALCEGLLYSPKLQAMYSETISEQLDEAMKDYLNSNISVDADNKLVYLPQLLDLYSLDFDEGTDLSNSPYEGLLNFLLDFMGPQLAKPLDKLLSLNPIEDNVSESGSLSKKQLPIQVHLQPLSLKPGIKLDYASSESFDDVHVPCSAISPESKIINYLRERCPLVAHLYELLTNNDFGQKNQLPPTGRYPISCYLEQRWNQTSQTSLLKSKDPNEFNWFVSALSPVPLTDFTLEQVQIAFRDRQWETALQYIDTFVEFQPVAPGFAFMRQLLLETLAGLDPNGGGCPWAWAIAIPDPTARAKTVLLHVHKWEKGFAMEALEYCISDGGDHDYIIPLQLKLREIEVYQKILDASLSLGSDASEAFVNWQDIADKSVWDQSSILSCIKDSGDFLLAVEWCELHVVNSASKSMALAMQIVWYLKQDPPQCPKVLQILESCSNSAECVELIEQALPEIESMSNKLFLVEFLVRMGLEYHEQCHYLNMVLGLKMLDAVDSVEKSQYYHLVSHPHLLLEQFLMNNEVNNAELSLKAVFEDLNSDTYMAVSLSPLSVNQLLECYATKALELPVSDDLSESNMTILDSEEVSFNLEQFVMPTAIPTKEQWVPDSRIRVCQCCKQEQFNMFSRRHHCRRCGRVICANCSQNVLVLEGLGKYGVRVCDDCYNQTMSNVVSGRQTPPFKSFSLDKRYKLLSSMKSGGQRGSPLLADYYVVKQRTNSVAYSEMLGWMLTDNDEHNTAVRSEFFYDSAPSVSLCLSILKLHSNVSQCSKFMLTLCDQLIGKLIPKSSGKLNAEVDQYLVMDMIRTFLVNVKVKYHQLLDHKSEDLVDTYFERLEIIEMLLNAHCPHLIPKEVILKNETVRKLRDRLLEEERMSLALEISTSYGIDKTRVWSFWGMFCLRAGDWPTAREKFKNCLKVIKDRGKRTGESPTLHNVISYLEKHCYSGQGKAAAIYKTLALRNQILKGNTKIVQEADTFDEHVKPECLYYLTTYGSHYSTVAFFQRHGLITDALSYITKEKCEPDVFVESLFMPALRCSQFPTLLQQLVSSDMSLTKWWPFLLSCCRHLQRIKYQNVLYQMQIFMRDYIRAAKSSIAFYLAAADSYSVLYFERNHHLHNAKRHFEMYLSKWQGATSFPSRIKNVLVMPENEIRSYIRTIQLQEELSQYFKLCDPSNLKSLDPDSDINGGKNSEKADIPTLFSGWNKKLELVSLVLVNAVKVREGFDLAEKLIKEYQLPPLSTISAAGRELVRLQLLDYIPHFLQNIRMRFSNDIDLDDVIMECIEALMKQGGDVNSLMKLLTSDLKKINAYLFCGQLKSAYLLAIKLQRPQDVRRVMKAADQTGQLAVKKICERWLLSSIQKANP